MKTSIYAKVPPAVLALCAAVPAGYLFYLLRIPLPWMLGPLTATLIVNAAIGNRVRWPMGLRNAALIVMGYSMGRTITPETTLQIVRNLPEMFAATVLTLAFSLFMGYVTCRRTGISLASGMLGSIPGGLSQMVLLTEEVKGADMTVVAFMQTVRLLAIVFIVPFVATYGMTHAPGGTPPQFPGIDQLGIEVLPAIVMAPLGAWLACRLRVPTPYLLGPVLGTAAAVLAGCPAPPVPRPLLNAAQVSFGIYLGIGMTLAALRQLGRVFPYAIGGAVALVGFTFLVGLGLTALIPATLLTTFLGTSPGGIAEMGTVAVILHADIATVLAFQLFRLLSILLLVPPLLKWRLNR